MWRLHPSARRLLRFNDGELPDRQAIRLLEHLSHCPECQSVAARQARAAAAFDASQRDTPLPDVQWAQVRLRAALAAAEAHTRNPRAGHLRWALAVSLGLAVVAGGGWWLRHRRPAAPFLVTVGWLPNPHLTPGVTQPIALTQLCSQSEEMTELTVAPALRQRVFGEYGMLHAQSKNFEVDYLITPGLGGTGNIRNLWPEPRYHAIWNSYVKDQLERYLHTSVCRGEVPLATAQSEIAHNWILAYKHYFRTNLPHTAPAATAAGLAASTSFVLLEQPNM